MKLSVFTVSTPDVTVEELIVIARKAGISGIEWRYKERSPELSKEAPSYWGNNKCTIDTGISDEQLAALGRRAQEAGLTNVALVPYLAVGDAAATEQAMRRAQLIGAKMIRVAVSWYNREENYNHIFQRTVVYLEQVEQLARKYGVKGLVETHQGSITPSASLAHRLVSRFDPQFIGVLYDPGNLVLEGYENFRMGLELLGDYLAHVHVKNAGWFVKQDGEQTWKSDWVPFSEGIVDWRQVLADLKSVGYDGWLGAEDFSGKYATAETLEFYAKWMDQLVANLA